MSKLAELRQQYPQYQDMSDQQLADAYHDKYYADIPKDEYYSKIGLNQAAPSLLDSAANDVNQHINQPIEALGRSARDIVGGAAQGLLNVGPGLYNLGASGINALGGNVPKSPEFDFAGNSPSAQVGNVASFFAGPSVLRGLGKIPEITQAIGSASKIPMIANAIKSASNILSKAPTTARIAGNALLGGAYSPDHPLIGMGLGGAAGAVGEGISKGYSGIKNAIGNNEFLQRQFAKINPSARENDIKNFLLDTHDALENRAAQTFQTVDNEVNKRGLNSASYMRPNTESKDAPYIDSNFIKNLKPYFSKTLANANLLKSAKDGDYNALRKIQSDLYIKAKRNLASESNADRDLGEEMLEKRDNINQAISNHLKNTGNNDLDELLTSARNDWDTLKQTYYNKHLPAPLVKMFDANIRDIPNNLTSILSKNSNAMNELRDFHPGIDEKVRGHRITKNVLKKLGQYSVPGATAIGGYEYGKR